MGPVVGVSIVIPARNAAGTLPVQLGALARQDYPGTWEIVVADNGSTDATPRIIREWQDRLPQLRRVSVPEVGLDRARNGGIAAASGDRVLCCDADDEVSPAWITALDRALRTADVAGGPLEYDRLNPPAVPRPRPADHATTALPSVFGRPYGVGANLGFRRSVFDTIGGFDEDMVAGGADDVDFCWRAADAGFSLAFAPDAVVHYRLRSSLRARARQQYGYARGEANLYAKHQALGSLPRRDLRRQLRGAGARARDLLAGTARLGTVEGRQALVCDAARLAGSIRAVADHHVFV